MHTTNAGPFHVVSTSCCHHLDGCCLRHVTYLHPLECEHEQEEQNIRRPYLMSRHSVRFVFVVPLTTPLQSQPSLLTHPQWCHLLHSPLPLRRRPDANRRLLLGRHQHLHLVHHRMRRQHHRRLPRDSAPIDQTLIHECALHLHDRQLRQASHTVLQIKSALQHQFATTPHHEKQHVRNYAAR
jgi:hypothetical protein